MQIAESQAETAQICRESARAVVSHLGMDEAQTGQVRKRGPGRPPKAAAADIAASKKAFLEAFAEHGWDEACRIACVSTHTPSSWRRRDPEFHAALEELDAEIADRYEKIADEAIRGLRQIDKTAATLLIFRLKALRPRKYREGLRIEHTGADGGAIQVDQRGDSSQGARMLREWGARIGVERN